MPFQHQTWDISVITTLQTKTQKFQLVARRYHAASTKQYIQGITKHLSTKNVVGTCLQNTLVRVKSKHAQTISVNLDVIFNFVELLLLSSSRRISRGGDDQHNRSQALHLEDIRSSPHGAPTTNTSVCNNIHLTSPVRRKPRRRRGGAGVKWYH